MSAPNRNDPCPCGSGKKYKQCCLRHDQALAAGKRSGETSIPKALQSALEFHQAGRLPQAETIYRQILQVAPNHPEALHFLGAIAYHEGNNEAAIELIRRAISVNPSPSMHYNLGNALQAQDNLDAAAESYRKALALKPDYAEAHTNLGNVLQAQGKLDEAVASYHRALTLKPDLAEAHYNLGNALQAQGKLDEAIASFHRALAIKPDYAEAHYNMGKAFMDQGKSEAAIESYQRVLALKPDYVEAHYNLGVAFQAQYKLDAAVESYHKALALKPDYAEARCNMGAALRVQGDLEAAVEHYHKALALKPDYADAYSNLLFLHGYHSLLAPPEYLSLACGWEQACLTAQDRQAARNRTFQRLPLAGRRLRVGYVSGDYRQHPVSYFVEQLFTHHDRTRIELFAYSTNSQRDAVTERLQALADHWIPLVGISDATARDRIEADGIDMLIDLSGHTSHNRMGVFALRAAPVQAYYLGYFASTGLTEMDYWIGDKILTPPETDSHFSEQVWRLPRISWSYDGKDAPPPAWRPDPDGTVWIGSFNNLSKLTPATLTLWAKVLHVLPEGRLLLKAKALTDAGNRQRILDAMSSYGIPSNRIELQDASVTPSWRAHMDYYSRLDIALDPVGAMGGVTTTCDALWMAVPVIALQGDRVASRATAAILDALGHPEWIAYSEAEYVDKVVALARDVEQRKALRTTQRNQMAHSPLCDARGLAFALEEAYFEMFAQLQIGRF